MGGLRNSASGRRALAAGAALAAVLTPALVLADASAPPSAAAQLFKLVLGLLVVVGMLFGLSRLLPRLGAVQTLTSGQLQVVSSLPVGQRERVVVVQVGEQQVMVGVAPGRVSVLHVLEQPLQSGPTRQAVNGAQGATGWLARALAGRAR